MSDFISRQDAINAVTEVDMQVYEGNAAVGRRLYLTQDEMIAIIKSLPSAEPETITIEEVSNQLGCATIQSALYWFEFLKTLDLLGFAIVRKKTR